MYRLTDRPMVPARLPSEACLPTPPPLLTPPPPTPGIEGLAGAAAGVGSAPPVVGGGVCTTSTSIQEMLV